MSADTPPIQREGQVVFTHKARCRDCYRCLRACPVKAIRLCDGQATVVDERCIACGTCVRECPQGAKAFRDDSATAAALLAGDAPVAASVAPSFAGLFEDWEIRRLPSALRRLGFARVEETVLGAHPAAVATRAALERRPAGEPVLCSACPAAVRWIERYRPAALPWLADVVSPMVAHARALRGERPETAVVFIGPCVAKKEEADGAGEVDLALTFEELRAWFQRAEIDLAELEESDFDRAPTGDSAAFPLPGGLARSAGLDADLLSEKLIVAEGPEALADAVDTLLEAPEGMLVEALFCRHGCVNGPAAGSERPLLARRNALLSYAARRRSEAAAPETDVAPIAPSEAQPVPTDEFTEEDIRRALEATGKGNPEERLDCGACGYATCRDKTIAVLRGMAEPEMCIPRMRHLAEQRTDRIIESSPNGILILDEHLRILHMNPAFRRLFRCSEAVLGRPVSYLMDAEPFERVVVDGGERVDFTAQHSRYGVVCRQILYPLAEEGQIVGIFVDLTDTRQKREALESLRARTVLHAQELMEHQVELAQNVARLLGESTARSEELVGELVELVDSVPASPAPTTTTTGGWQQSGTREPPWAPRKRR